LGGGCTRYRFPGGGVVMNELYAWAAIGLIILASTTGDVLLSYSMKRVGHVGELWEQRGVLAVIGRINHAHVCAGPDGDGGRVLQPAFRPFLGKPQLGRTGFGLAHLCGECAGGSHIPARTSWAPALDCGIAGSGWRDSDG